jgi:hypothetical protein
MTLPTTKTPPTLDMATAKLLVYGPPGIGKTTLAASVDADHTLLLATEPGTGGIEAYVQPIRSWEEFLATGSALANDKHDFHTVAVDTADELFRFCQEHVMAQHHIAHPSDLEWGKGWQLLSDEFRLRVGRLCNLGLGVIFTSHSKDEEVKQRVGSITRSVPTIAGQGGKFLMGFVDYILFATSEHTEDGEVRMLRTSPSENWIAKARIELPDPILLPKDDPAGPLREAMGQPVAA